MSPSTSRFRRAALACSISTVLATPLALADPQADAISVVKSFNAAFGKKDIEGLVANCIDGGVVFDLRPAHADQSAPQSLTQDIKEKWYGVTPILFAAAASYTRTVEILDSRATEDMATVWTKTTATTVMQKADRPSTNSFNEVYFLVHTPKGWKIGAMMDNRATDNISTAVPAPSARK
jgi:hypothetical protein